jgi:hypothetical protein
MLLPSFIAAEEEIAVVAFQIATLTNFKNDIQMSYLHLGFPFKGVSPET